MGRFTTHLRAVFVSGALALCGAGAPLFASETLDRLYQELAEPDNSEWRRVESDIQREWSKSGSPVMDLLLKRGEEAIDAGDLDAAVEHLTALTDHAPDFAAGWNARASAYFLMGQLGPAVSDSGQVLQLDARHYDALDGLAIILEQLGRDDQALAVFRASLDIHPHQEEVQQAIERLELKSRGTAL